MRAAPSVLSLSPRVDCKHTHTHKHVTLHLHVHACRNSQRIQLRRRNHKQHAPYFQQLIYLSSLSVANMQTQTQAGHTEPDINSL